MPEKLLAEIRFFKFRIIVRHTDHLSLKHFVLRKIVRLITPIIATITGICNKLNRKIYYKFYFL